MLSHVLSMHVLLINNHFDDGSQSKSNGVTKTCMNGMVGRPVVIRFALRKKVAHLFLITPMGGDLYLNFVTLQMPNVLKRPINSQWKTIPFV